MPINTTKKLTPDKRLYKLLIVPNRPACQELEKTMHPIIYYEVPKKSSVSLFFKMLLAVFANNFRWHTSHSQANQRHAQDYCSDSGRARVIRWKVLRISGGVTVLKFLQIHMSFHQRSCVKSLLKGMPCHAGVPDNDGAHSLPQTGYAHFFFCSP